VTITTAFAVVAPLVAVPLNVTRDLAAQLLVVELAGACLIHALCQHFALVFAGRRMIRAVLCLALCNRLSRDFGAAVFIAPRIDAHLEQLATRVCTPILAGRRLWALAVVVETVQKRRLRELCANGFIFTWLEAV
jgi:hypothetical protein